MYKLEKDKETLTIEIEKNSRESKNKLLSHCYKPLKGITENLTVYLASIFQRVQNEK